MSFCPGHGSTVVLEATWNPGDFRLPYFSVLGSLQFWFPSLPDHMVLDQEELDSGKDRRREREKDRWGRVEGNTSILEVFVACVLLLTCPGGSFRWSWLHCRWATQMTLRYFLSLECVHARPLMASARPRKHSLVYVSAAAERRDDGIEHTVVYKLLGLNGAWHLTAFKYRTPLHPFSQRKFSWETSDIRTRSQSKVIEELSHSRV